ncbi:MAG: hypothetical protein RIQ83_890, partial [Pseudomonadota bacterium]
MSQVITNAFEQYWQSSLAAEQPVVLDEFILADIPDLDITSPIDPDTGLPPESQIVHRQNVDQRGRINNNAVAYTIVMDTTFGDFSFNAMYLRNKANGVIGMIVYKGRETKLKTDQTTGQTGNSLVKSMLMGYDQAAEATLTNVDAGTWQIDYAARLRGQDEDLRQLASQLYGHHTFIGDGFKVVQQDGGHQVTQGVAIVGGLRIELKQPQVIYPGTKPIGVWVDVHRSGSLLSEHQNHFTIITSVAELADHVDESGYPHYVAKLATVQADSTVIDGRGQGGSGGSGAIPDTFALWKRSMAEAGYDLIGQFGTKLTIQKAKQVLLSKNGTEVYQWQGALPKDVPADATLESTGGLNPGLWLDVSAESLRGQLAGTSGSKLVGLPIGNLSQAIMFVTPEMANAPCNGIDDDAPYVIAAIQHAAPRKIPVVMNGNYLFKTEVDMVLSNVEITGSGTITHEKKAFRFSGVVGNEVPLTANINDFSAVSIDIADASGFEQGDIGIVHSSIMCLSTDALSMQLGDATQSGSPSWFGEFFQVVGKTGNKLHLSTPLVYNRYPTTAAPFSGTRQASTVKKVTPVTGIIAGSIKFSRAGTDTAVEIYYGRGFKVTGKFDAKKLPGASVIFAYSLDCETAGSLFRLDPDTPITYGTVNPGHPSYFQFNTVKCISSQGCGASNCNFENPSQTFDVTYFEMPSTICYMRGCTVLFARFNMATSHGGSFGNVFSANTGINCWRGIALRSREDVAMGNRIYGFRKYPNSLNTNSETYGVSLTEGYTVGATIKDNYISG